MTTAPDNHTEHNFCQSPRYHRHRSVSRVFCRRVFWKNYFKPVIKTAATQSWFHRPQVKTKGKTRCKGQSICRIPHLTTTQHKTKPNGEHSQRSKKGRQPSENLQRALRPEMAWVPGADLKTSRGCAAVPR